ncbi:MAG: hypothetical protein ACM3WQ_06650 [Chloroflexota bacterium]|nr:hypothetical protein [Candidatus Sulfotelmatobacter sp.]
MQSLEFGEKQGVELCENVAKMLTSELESATVRTKIKRMVADYVNKRDIAYDPERLMKRLNWTIKVRIMK